MADTGNILDLASLKQTFERLRTSSVDGVAGVVCLDSGEPGPVAGVTVCTHGNEPAGLALAEYLLSDSFTLHQGKLYLICNNLEATACFFDAACDDTREGARYLEANMNRLPEDLMEQDGDSTILPYEWKRAQALYPIWQALDGGVMDVHSTSAAAPPMLIMHSSEARSAQALIADIPVGIVIAGIDAHIRGKFMIEFCGVAQRRNRLILECGQHLCGTTRKTAIQAVQAWLRNMEMMPVPSALPEEKVTQKARAHYHVFDALSVPGTHEAFYLIRPIAPFSYLEKGCEIAKGEKGGTLCAAEAGYAVMCPSTNNRLSPTEAVLFLATLESGDVPHA